MRTINLLFILLVTSLSAFPQWYQAKNIPTDRDLSCIMFTDAWHGWICGDQGVMLRTADGGNNWALVETGTTAKLMDVFFADNLHGWALGEEEDNTNLILVSVDGGVNWSIQHTTDYMLTDLFFTDSMTGWVTAWYNTLLHTTDGGVNWVPVSMPSLAMPNAIQFLNPMTGYLGGTNYNSGFEMKVYKTTDGGQNWTKTAIWNNDWYLYRLFFIDEMNGWLTGHYDIQGIHNQDTSGNVICFSNNGGQGWEKGFDKENLSARSLFFTNAMQGWAVAGNGIFLGSTDGGQSWQMQSYPPYNYLADIWFSDSQTGWAVGDSGTVMQTTNNGALGTGEIPSDNHRLKLFPNPACKNITLTLDGDWEGEASYRIFNILGNTVKTGNICFNGSLNILIDIEALPDGIYFCLVSVQTPQSACHRAIVKFVKANP